LDAQALETERLEAEITTLAGHIAAATCRWLLLVGEFDRRQAWVSWGCTSCAHWLSWQCAMGLRAAREHVRVAHALLGLPAIREAFAEGRLSYSQVRALTRVAEPERERELLELARHATAAQLERLVRGYLSASTLREQARDSYEGRELSWRNEPDGSLVICARLPADDGALVLQALQATADRLRDAGRGAGTSAALRDPGSGGSAEPPLARSPLLRGEDRAQSAGECSAEPPAPARGRALLADALVELARGTRAGDAPAEQVRVVVNVDLESLVADAPGTCRLACGTVLAPETARRLGCDQQVAALHHKDGRARAGAAAARFASPRLNRLLDQRDRGCRFPGCTHSRYLHTHHIVHWAHGGRTIPDNLVRLCSHHHRLVHEGGYSIAGHPAGELVFRRPDGRPLRERADSRAGSTQTLTDLNRRHGVQPDPTTITPHWHGDKLDIDWAITVLLDNH
jgi:hypothetical protein